MMSKKYDNHFYFCSGGANKKSKTFTFVPMKSYLVAKLYPDSDAKSKEKLTFPPHRTNSKTQPTRKRNFEKTFTFTRQIFIFSPPHTVTGLFSSDRPLFGSDGAVKVMALTALKTSVDTLVLIGKC